MKTTIETSSQLELFTSSQNKPLMEVLAQLERIQYRYRKHNIIYAHQIEQILSFFEKFNYNVYREIADTKIQTVDEKKLYKNIHLLKEFNKRNSTKWGLKDYLHASIDRSKYKEKISLMHPHSFPKIQENINMLKELGFVDKELDQYLIHSMDLITSGYLNYSPQRNREHIDRLKQELEFSDDEIKIFIYQVQDFFYRPLTKYKEKILYLEKLGYQKEQIKGIIKKFPHCLEYSGQKINNGVKKIVEISKGYSRILLQYPHLLYFNAETDFFRRLVTGLIKGYKRYKNIIKRIENRFAYTERVNHIYQRMFFISSEEEYLNGFKTEEYKKNFVFNPEEAEKAFAKWRDKIFDECLQYIFPAEQKIIMMIYQKDQKGEELSPNEKMTWEYLKTKIQKQSQQCYDDLFKVFNHTKDIVSRLSEDDDLPF